MLGINPAEILEGVILNNRWLVTEMVDPKSGGTGGTFSICYHAQEQGTNKKVFVKVLNLNAGRMLGLETLSGIKFLVSAFQYEKDVLKKCKNSKLKKVIIPIDEGEHVFDELPGFNTAFFLVFELANGNIRSIRSQSDKFDTTMCFRSLHNAALGIRELHNKGIFHQDIKPSNLLSVNANEFKISDLGNSHDPTIHSPWDDAQFSGDNRYAPIETRFIQTSERTIECRKAYDMYMLGGLIFYHYLDISPTEGILRYIRQLKLSINYSNYIESLASLSSAFVELLGELRDAIKVRSPKFEDEVVDIAKNLCNPDVHLRGNPRSRLYLHESNYSMERFISRFALLEAKSRF